MRIVLSKKFFNRSTRIVARELLGKFLVRRWRGQTLSVMITEVEAYDGPRDKASHAHRGQTSRNAPMFGEAGRWYVYLVYGMHWIVNIVTGPQNYPAAVLIRGGAIAKHTGEKNRNHYTLRDSRYTTLNGPGRLSQFLRIDKKLNDLRTGKKSNLWIEDRGIKIKKSVIKKRARIGVDYAGVWAEKLYNFSFESENVTG